MLCCRNNVVLVVCLHGLMIDDVYTAKRATESQPVLLVPVKGTRDLETLQIVRNLA